MSLKWLASRIFESPDSRAPSPRARILANLPDLFVLCIIYGISGLRPFGQWPRARPPKPKPRPKPKPKPKEALASKLIRFNEVLSYASCFCLCWAVFLEVALLFLASRPHLFFMHIAQQNKTNFHFNMRPSWPWVELKTCAHFCQLLLSVDLSGQQVVSCMWLEIWLTDCKTASRITVQAPHWPTNNCHLNMCYNFINTK